MRPPRKTFRRSLSALICLTLCLHVALARQAAGALRGAISDEQGGLIVGARVTLTVTGGVEKTAISNGEGAYSFTGLARGKYVLRVEAPGFAPYENGGVEIADGRAAVIDITLKPGLENQEVDVRSATGVSTNPEGNASAIIVRGAELDALPDDPEGLAAALQALAGPGAGPDGGQIYVDGFVGTRLPPKSSIREVRINQNPFSAEFDRLGFGRIEVITKAGASAYEGSTFFSFNDESLNARNPFSPRRAPFQYRRYGGNLSGPVAGKKTSFFADFERREIDDNAVVNATVLDASLAVTSFRQVLLRPQRRTIFSQRVDHQLNPNHTLTGRYSYTGWHTDNEGVGDLSLPSRAYDSLGSQHSVQLRETAVLGQKVINELRFQYSRDSRELGADNSATAIVALDAFVGGGAQVGFSRYEENRWEVGDNVMFASGQHTVRTGVRLRRAGVVDSSPQNFGGTLTFAGGLAPRLEDGRVVVGSDGRPELELITSIERFRRTEFFRRQGLAPAAVRALGGGVTQFSVARGNPEARVSQFDLGAFVQDDWRLRPDFTLNLGLRYEAQSNVGNNFNLAPRLAFAWAPSPGGGGRAQTVIRGGVGVFYSRFAESLTLQANRFNGATQQQFIVTDTAVLDRFPGVPSADELSDFAQPQTIRRVADDLRAPYSVQSAISVEQQLPRNTTLTINYLNLRGLHILRTRNVNAPLPGTFAPGTPGGVRPLGGIGNVYQYESSGVFNMSRLDLMFSTRFHRNVSLSATYGLGSARSDTDGVGTFPADQFDLSTEYGRSNLDVRHRFFLSGTIAAPWGLRLSPLVIAVSGRPFNIFTGRDANGDTLFTERPAFATDLASPGVVITPFGAFDPDPAPGQEIIPRNYGRGPAYAAVSLRLGRTFRFNFPGNGQSSAPAGTQTQPSGGGQAAARRPAEKRYALSLSVQAWNLFNRSNMSQPVGNISSPFFGRSTSIAGGLGAGDPLSGSRLVEMQVRLSF